MSEHRTYPFVRADHWVQPRRRGYYFRCCDCGLVHVMVFRLVKWRRGRKIQFRAYRDNRATGQIRRHMAKR